jgi:hypothetical protein
MTSGLWIEASTENDGRNYKDYQCLYYRIGLTEVAVWQRLIEHISESIEGISEHIREGDGTTCKVITEERGGDSFS